jgi:hypothetical protein
VTARRRLKGLRNHSAVQKLILTPLHKELRLGFALGHLAHDDRLWNPVIFYD